MANKWTPPNEGEWKNKKVFSLKEAAEFTGTPLGTLRYHVYRSKVITPLVKGKSVLFTRAQLVDYMRPLSDGTPRRRTNKTPDPEKWLTSAEVAEMADIDTQSLKHHVHVTETLSGYLVGQTLYYDRADVEKWLEARADQGLPVAI